MCTDHPQMTRPICLGPNKTHELFKRKNRLRPKWNEDKKNITGKFQSPKEEEVDEGSYYLLLS